MFCPGEMIKTVFLLQNYSVIMRENEKFLSERKTAAAILQKKEKDHTDLVLPCLNAIKTREIFFRRRSRFSSSATPQSEFFREKKGVNRVVVGSCERDRGGERRGCLSKSHMGKGGA